MSTENPIPVIEMKGVSVSSMRDPNTIVGEGVDWTVRPGDFWVIGGLHGSGKTDLLLLAAGLTWPAAGSYCFLGEPMPIFDEERLGERLRLGLVFDGGQLFNHLTVGENVGLPLRYHHDLSKAEGRERIRPLLEEFELGPWADSTPGALGRNWQKRVGLARALVLEPELLLIDNPLGGLDLRHRWWWLRQLERIAQGDQGMKPCTLVVTTADFKPWRERGRQFALLRERRLTCLGSWEELGAAAPELTQELIEPGS